MSDESAPNVPTQHVYRDPATGRRLVLASVEMDIDNPDESIRLGPFVFDRRVTLEGGDDTDG